MAQSILSIDIGSYSLKICELKRSLKDFVLMKSLEQPLEQGTRLTHEETVATALKTVLEKSEFSTDVVAVTLPSNLFSCRVIELPFTSIKKIEQTLDFELEGYIPVPLDELLIDYHILSVGENRSTVLAAYIPRTRFVKYLEMMKLVGIDPKYVGVDGIDLSNIAQIAMVPQGPSVYAMIDIGHHKTNICVMQGLRVQYVRSVTVGGLQFTRAIQKAFKLNFEKAEGLKLDRGKVSLREDDLDQISRLCQKVAEDLIVSIRQTYLGYKQIYPEDDWSGIYLTGGASRLPGLADVISQSTKLNVASLDFLDLIEHRIGHPELVGDLMATSMAAGLRVIFSNKALKINFRRGEFAYRRDIKALGGEIKELSIWFSVVLFLGIFHFLFSYVTLNSRIDKVNADLVEATIKALPELKDQKNKSAKQLLTIIASKTEEMKPQLKALKMGSEGEGALPLLLEISQKVPKKEDISLDVDDFTYTGDHVRLEGRTKSFEEVDKIKNALATSIHFKNVTSGNVVKGLRDEIKFSMSMDVVGGEGEK